ncbi:MAG: hypothetical protein LBJ12_02880 [Oscillospiraceae bacterium]|jgi:hypothetical protein|nr:hypothetical protein [Oscillospiraceae bacterium]
MFKLLKPFERHLEYIQKHAAAFAWLSAAAVGVVSAYGKLMQYLIEFGKISYWGLPLQIISFSAENILFELATGVLFAIIFFVPIFLIFCFCMLLLKLFKWLYKSQKWLFKLTNRLLIFLHTRRRKNEREKSCSVKLKLVVIIFAPLFMSFFGTYCSESRQHKFRIVNENYAIIYESSDKYYLAQCQISPDEKLTIDLQHQMVMDKSGELNYVVYTFKSIEKQTVKQ